jgi:hypothetical protein
MEVLKKLFKKFNALQGLCLPLHLATHPMIKQQSGLVASLSVGRHIFQYFFSSRNFVEEFKKGIEFLFFILMRGISGYFLLHTSAKNDYLI